MPLWSVEEWRVRIASSYSALGVWRPIKLRGYGGRIKSKRFVSSYADGRRYLSSFVEMCLQKMSSVAFMLLLFLVINLNNMISVSYLGRWARRIVFLFTEMNYLTVPLLKCVLLASSYFKVFLLYIGSIAATLDPGQVRSGDFSFTPSFATGCVANKMEDRDSDNPISMAFLLVVMATLLLESGNVERNPGPVYISGDEATVLHYLSQMDITQIRLLGVELGLQMVRLQNMQNLPWDMVIAWLRREDRVIEKCGEQLTWEVLVKALQRIGETGIADYIIRDKCESLLGWKTDIVTQLVPQEPIQRYAMYLKGVYKSALVSSDKFPNLTCNEFINLALVKGGQVSRSKADEFTKATLHGHVDEIMKQKQPIKLEEVLKPVEGQQYMKCVYMYGAPGVGKSTCVGELCRRWDEIDAVKKYSLVVLLRMREKRVQNAKNVEDLCYHDNREIQQAVAARIEAFEGENVLFVLDGFDELPVSLQRHSIFVRLIRGTYLSHCTVLVTSRPSSTADLLSVAQPQIHKQVEVIGFTQKHIKQYAKAFFSCQPDVLADFLTYISTHPAIRSLMYIPLNCAITAETYRHNRTVNRPIPQTMTQLYTEMSLTLLQRHLHVGEDDPSAEQLPERLEDLPLQLHEPFCLLSEQAFNGLESNEVIFHNLPNSFVHFGFMNSLTELYMGRKTSISHSFLHLTLQEFLAAFHICQLQPSEQKKVFKKHCEIAGWDVVWRFVAGLSGFSGIGWEVVQSKRGRDKDGKVKPFLIRCLYEAQEKMKCDSVFGHSIVYFDGRSSLTAFDCYAVGYCVANSKCMWEVDIGDNQSLQSTLFEMLKHGLCSSNISPEQEHKNVVFMSLSSCDLNSTAFNLLADLVPLLTNLEELDISYNSAGDGGLVKLLRSLSRLKHLQTLDMHGTSISYADIETFHCLISPSSSLKELIIGSVYFSSEDTEFVLKTLLSPSSLERLMLHRLQFTAQAVTLLEQNNNLKSLEIYDSSSKLISSVAKALCKNSHLKVLSIELLAACFEDEAVSSLVDMIHSNSTLETLILSVLLTQEQLLKLNSALQFNHTLKTIETYKPCSLKSTLDPRVMYTIGHRL